jgi:alanine racemase
MSRPIRAELSAAALRHNYELAKHKAPNAQVFAVVKANAYGHGIDFAKRALKSPDAWATLELDSAVRLRQLGATEPILMLEGFFSEDELNTFVTQKLMTVVHNAAQIGQISKATLSRPLDTFVKINTGMNRLGFTDGGARYALGMAATGKNFGDITLMTHFAASDGKDGVAAQMREFKSWEKIAKETMQKKPFTVSVANSAAVLRFPDTHRDWVRPGIMLYGSSPFDELSADAIGLKPVMSLRSEIIGVQMLEKGQAVGYGGTYVAKKKTRIGVVACGYADGYPRHAPGTHEHSTPVLVAGKRTRTVGRVSMDMLCVDLTDIPVAKEGTPVVLWGEGLSIDEVAHASGTVGYELMCAVAPRVPKVEVA